MNSGSSTEKELAVPKILNEPTERIHFILWKSDVEWLRQTFGDRQINSAVRTLIRSFKNQKGAELRRSIDQINQTLELK